MKQLLFLIFAFVNEVTAQPSISAYSFPNSFPAAPRHKAVLFMNGTAAVLIGGLDTTVATAQLRVSSAIVVDNGVVSQYLLGVGAASLQNSPPIGATYHILDDGSRVIVGGFVTTSSEAFWKWSSGGWLSHNIASLPPRRDHASVLVGNVVFLIGGEKTGVLLDDIMAVDMVSKSVFTMPFKLPQPTKQLAAAYHPVTRMVYVHGGVTSSFSPAINTWSMFVPSTATTGLSNDTKITGGISLDGHSMVAYNEFLILLGGGGPLSSFAYIVDVTRSRPVMSIDIPNGPSRRKFHSVAYTPGSSKVHVYGGVSGDTFAGGIVLSDLWELTFIIPTNSMGFTVGGQGVTITSRGGPLNSLATGFQSQKSTTGSPYGGTLSSVSQRPTLVSSSATTENDVAPTSQPVVDAPPEEVISIVPEEEISSTTSASTTLSGADANASTGIVIPQKTLIIAGIIVVMTIIVVAAISYISARMKDDIKPKTFDTNFSAQTQDPSTNNTWFSVATFNDTSMGNTSMRAPLTGAQSEPQSPVAENFA